MSYKAGSEPVPGYRLVKYLGGGGFGQVWEAVAPGGRHVAVKVVRLDGRAGIKEFTALSLFMSLIHAHLVDVHGCWLKDDAGRILSDDETALAMPSASGQDATRQSTKATLVITQAEVTRADELIIAMGLANGTLADRLEKCKRDGKAGIPPAELLKYMASAADAIDFLNHPSADDDPPRDAIRHCDIKPANLLLFGGVCKVGDFSLARRGDDARMTSLTVSAAYTSPELADERPPSAATDQYSLAISYFELRTGMLPFSDTASIIRVLQAHRDGLLDLSPLPAAEREVIRKATSLDPERRYPSATEMVEALRAAVVQSGAIDLNRSDAARGSAAGGSAPVAGSARGSGLEETVPFIKGTTKNDPVVDPVKRRRRLRRLAAAGLLLMLATVLSAALVSSLGIGAGGGGKISLVDKWKADLDQRIAAGHFEQAAQELRDAPLEINDAYKDDKNQEVVAAWLTALDAQLTQRAGIQDPRRGVEQLRLLRSDFAALERLFDHDRAARLGVDSLSRRLDGAVSQRLESLLAAASAAMAAAPAQALADYQAAHHVLHEPDQLAKYPQLHAQAVLGAVRAAARSEKWDACAAEFNELAARSPEAPRTRSAEPSAAARPIEALLTGPEQVQRLILLALQVRHAQGARAEAPDEAIRIVLSLIPRDLDDLGKDSWEARQFDALVNWASHSVQAEDAQRFVGLFSAGRRKEFDEQLETAKIDLCQHNKVSECRAFLDRARQIHLEADSHQQNQLDELRRLVTLIDPAAGADVDGALAETDTVLAQKHRIYWITDLAKALDRVAARDDARVSAVLPLLSQLYQQSPWDVRESINEIYTRLLRKRFAAKFQTVKSADDFRELAVLCKKLGASSKTEDVAWSLCEIECQAETADGPLNHEKRLLLLSRLEKIRENLPSGGRSAEGKSDSKRQYCGYISALLRLGDHQADERSWLDTQADLGDLVKRAVPPVRLPRAYAESTYRTARLAQIATQLAVCRRVAAADRPLLKKMKAPFPGPSAAGEAYEFCQIAVDLSPLPNAALATTRFLAAGHRTNPDPTEVATLAGELPADLDPEDRLPVLYLRAKFGPDLVAARQLAAQFRLDHGTLDEEATEFCVSVVDPAIAAARAQHRVDDEAYFLAEKGRLIREHRWAAWPGDAPTLMFECYADAIARVGKSADPDWYVGRGVALVERYAAGNMPADRDLLQEALADAQRGGTVARAQALQGRVHLIQSRLQSPERLNRRRVLLAGCLDEYKHAIQEMERSPRDDDSNLRAEWLVSISAADVDLANYQAPEISETQRRTEQIRLLLEAEEAARAATEIEPRRYPHWAWQALGNAEEDLAWWIGEQFADRWDAAVMAFGRAIDARSDYVPARIDRGRTQYKRVAYGGQPTKHLQDALRDLREACERSPEAAEAHYWRGLTLNKLGQSDEGAQELWTAYDCASRTGASDVEVLKYLEDWANTRFLQLLVKIKTAKGQPQQLEAARAEVDKSLHNEFRAIEQSRFYGAAGGDVGTRVRKISKLWTAQASVYKGDLKAAFDILKKTPENLAAVDSTDAELLTFRVRLRVRMSPGNWTPAEAGEAISEARAAADAAEAAVKGPDGRRYLDKWEDALDALWEAHVKYGVGADLPGARQTLEKLLSPAFATRPRSQDRRFELLKVLMEQIRHELAKSGASGPELKPLRETAALNYGKLVDARYPNVNDLAFELRKLGVLPK